MDNNENKVNLFDMLTDIETLEKMIQEKEEEK
jgi:hypothetical protein